MWPEYKTGQGVEPQLLAQFPLLEETLRALGVVVWAMEEYEADDALASAAFLAQEDIRVKRVVISTPDKDLAQCVLGTRVVQLDRRRRLERDEQGVIQKFGVKPSSIPDYLALVGDAADGYPGLPGWGAKSASAVLSRFGRLEAIPSDARDWHVNVSNPKGLSQVLNSKRNLAFLFRDLAMLRTDLPLFATVDDLLWKGPTTAFPLIADRLDKAKFSKKRVPRS
jgi:5'-3' exonuclease